MTPSDMGRSLREMVRELTGKERERAIRRTLRAEARRLKNAAMRNMSRAADSAPRSGKRRKRAKRLSGRELSRKLRPTVRARDLKRADGLMVAAMPHGNAGMHRNRKGQLKPAAFWADSGTSGRTTRRGGHNRGGTPALGYIAKTEREELPKSRDEIIKSFRKEVERIISKRR